MDMVTLLTPSRPENETAGNERTGIGASWNEQQFRGVNVAWIQLPRRPSTSLAAPLTVRTGA
jgi:hypothetical protein